MSDTDDDPTDPRFGRDESGRFKKGFSGNLGGRPRKQPQLSPDDLTVFGQTLIPIVVDGRPTKQTRNHAALGKLFALGMSGRITALREYLRRIDTVREAQALAQLRVNEIEEQYLEAGKEMPDAVFRQYERFADWLTMGELKRSVNREFQKNREIERRRQFIERRRQQPSKTTKPRK